MFISIKYKLLEMNGDNRENILSEEFLDIYLNCSQFKVFLEYVSKSFTYLATQFVRGMFNLFLILKDSFRNGIFSRILKYH